MKNEFSKHWISSKRPGKQRKYLAKAPLHLRGKFLNVSLSKELRKKYGKRAITVRKGDKVRVLVGKFRKKEGKVTEVNYKRLKIFMEGIQVKKLDGSMTNVPLRNANLQIIELNLDDKKRLESINRKVGIKGSPTKLKASSVSTQSDERKIEIKENTKVEKPSKTHEIKLKEKKK